MLYLDDTTLVPHKLRVSGIFPSHPRCSTEGVLVTGSLLATEGGFSQVLSTSSYMWMGLNSSWQFRVNFCFRLRNKPSGLAQQTGVALS